MFSLTKFFLVLGLSICSGSAFSAPSVSCPAQLIKQSVSTSAAVDGWDLHLQKTIKFSGVEFMGGPMNSDLWLKHDGGSETKTELTQIWNFAGNPKGNWIVCFYGADSVTLSQKLPDNIRQCTVVSNKSSRVRLKHSQLSCK